MAEREELQDRAVYMLFAPQSGRGLKVDYPELNDHDEFKVLRRSEMLFIWFYGCKSSPYFNLNKPEREIVEMCIEASGMRINEPARREKFLSQNFPEKIQQAIPVMNSFEPAARIMAKLSSVKEWENLNRMTSITVDKDGNHEQFEDKDGDVDFGKKDKYMSMAIKFEKEKVAFIQNAERGGFGIRAIRDGGNKNLDDGGWTFLETYHQNN